MGVAGGERMISLGFCLSSGAPVHTRGNRLQCSRVRARQSRQSLGRTCRAAVDVADFGVQEDDDAIADNCLFAVRPAAVGCDLFKAADLRSRCFRQGEAEGISFFQYRKAVLEWMYNTVKRDDSFCFVAVERGVPEEEGVIGTLDATIHNALPGEVFPRSIYVSSIAVRKDRRRRGVASAMLSEVDQLALRLNITSIFLHVEPWNTAAVKLYRTSGYQRYQGELCKWLRALSKAENTLLHKNLAWARK